MNYQTMQHQARDKHQQLRQEAQTHRLARQAKSAQTAPGHFNSSGKLAAAFVTLAIVGAAVIALLR